MKIISWAMQLFTPETMNGFFGYPKLNPVGESYQRVFHMDFSKLIPLEETVARLREANVIVCVPAINNEMTYGTSTSSFWVRDIVSQFPDVFIGFASPDPHSGVKALEDLDRDVKEFGFQAIYLQPMGSTIPADDRLYYPMYARACELGIPVFMPCSVHYNLTLPMDLQHPNHVDRVAMDFPSLTIVLRHGLYPWIWETAAVMMRHPQIFLEISSFRHKVIHPEWLRLIDTVFKERTVYGAGHFSLTPKENVEEFMQLDLKKETKENILYNTSRKLLKVDNS